MERNGETVFLLRTKRNGTRTERFKKKERKRNDSVEGPRSRTERNDFKKVGTCPALDNKVVSHDNKMLINSRRD